MLITFQGRTPRVAANAFIAPTAILIGDVDIAEGASVWFGAVLRGDTCTISVGAGSSIQDNSTLHGGSAVIVEEDVTVGHNVVLHDCTVRSGALIGMGAVVLDRADIGTECVVAGGSVVKEGYVAPSRHLIAGNPADVKKELAGGALEWTKMSAPGYRHLAALYVELGLAEPRS